MRPVLVSVCLNVVYIRPSSETAFCSPLTYVLYSFVSFRCSRIGCIIGLLSKSVSSVSESVE